MAKKPIGVICLILLSVLFAPYQGNAQPSSLGQSQTLSEFWAWNQTIVVAEWISSKKRDNRKPGSTTFKIVRVLKGRATDGQVGDRITLAHHVAAEAAATYLVSGETTNGKTQWGEIRRADKTTITYFKQAPAIEAAPPKRLAYFVRFLDATDQRVARDAARELSIAGFKHISAMSSDDLQLLRESIERSSKSGEFRLLLHYLIVGYVLAKGEDGLAVIDESILKNKDAAFTTTYSVMQALRYIWSDLPSNISRDRLLQSMRLVLDRPEFADLVISELARWKDWSVQDRIMRLYEAPETAGVFVVKRAIVRYMRASTNDLPMEKKDKPPRHVVKGREYLATLKKQDPKTYRKALLFDLQRKTDKKPKRSLSDITGRISGPVDPKASWLSSEVIYSYAIHTFAFSPDGKTLVSGSGDGTVRWWNTVTGRRIETIKGHSTWCFSIAFRPDGKHMVTGSGDQLIKIWDVDRRRPIATLKGHDDDVHAVAFDPTGQQLFSAGDDMTVRVHNLNDRTILYRMEGHTEAIPCLAVSSKEPLIATGSRDDAIRIWDIAAGKQLQLLKGHTDDVHSVAFSPDGKTLASASYDETVKLWDVKTGKLWRTLRSHSNWVFSVAYSPDGKLLASGDKDGRIIVWNSQTGKKLAVLKRQRLVSFVAFSPDGSTLASSSPSATICLWDPRAFTLRKTLTVKSREDIQTIRLDDVTTNK